MAEETGVKTPQEPQSGSEKPQATEPEKPAAQEAAKPQEAPIVDSHGQPGINKERHDKEVGELKATIKELQEQLAEKAKSEAGREEMGKKIAELEQRLEEETVNHSLEMERCRNVKAARALLGDYGGDVKKLKEAEPWLFQSDQPTGSTGAKPTGAAQGESELDAQLRKAAGLKMKG